MIGLRSFKRAVVASAFGALPAAALAQTIDGQNIPAEFGTALALQRYNTAFGTDTTPGQFADRAEADGLYVTNDTGNLYIGVPGNLQNNGNSLVIFIDSNGPASGANFLLMKDFGIPIAGLPRYLAGDQGGNSGFDNIMFDADFAPDFVLGLSGGSPVASQTATYWLVNWTTLADNGAGNPFAHTNQVLGLATSGDPTASGPAGTLGTFLSSNSLGVKAAGDNSETLGVDGGACGAPGADPAAAGAAATQTRGFEFSVPLSLMGLSVGESVCLVAFISNENGFISNQVVPSAQTEPMFACIGDRALGTITYDFNSVSGDQFACYTIDAGGCPNDPSMQCAHSDIFPAGGGDCQVNISDLGVLLSNYNPAIGGKTRDQGDVFPLTGGDGFVNLSDLGQLLSDFNADCR